MPDITYLWLVPAIIGYTEAIKTQFPSISKLSPFIAILVAILGYLGVTYMSPQLFGLLYAVGSSMGIYTTVKTVSNVTISNS